MTIATPRDSDHADPELGRGAGVALVVFLAFIGFPVVQMLSSSAGAAHKALVLALVAAFVATYLWTMVTTPAPATVRDALVVLAVLATVVSLVDDRPFSLLFIYIAA